MYLKMCFRNFSDQNLFSQSIRVCAPALNLSQVTLRLKKFPLKAKRNFPSLWLNEKMNLLGLAKIFAIWANTCTNSGSHLMIILSV
jgi:hypothetical protein